MNVRSYFYKKILEKRELDIIYWVQFMIDLRKYIKKVAKLPPRILIKKIYQKINNKIYYSIREKKIIKNPIEIVSKIFNNFKPTIEFLFDINKKEYYMQELKKIGKEEQIIKQANKVCNHIFNLLGSGDINLGKKIKWNEDFKTGFVWENKFYKKIITVDLNNSADAKVPWELSRFQHIPTLGQAYLLTNEPKYPMEFTKQINSWIINNPVEMSINWTCAMDVAIRACNWITGYYFFKNCSDINQEFWIKFNKILYLHGKFIFDNLEKADKFNGNHYLTDLVGLIWLGLYFKNLEHDKEDSRNNPELWLNFGLKEFEKEMKNQINSDGTDYEASTAYHCFVTELFLFTSILCSKNNIIFSKEYRNKLGKMIEFIVNITKPNGYIPLFGDMDSGRFIILSNYGAIDKRDFRYLITLGGEYFSREDFMFHPSNNDNQTSLWCFKDATKVKGKLTYKLKSKAYKDGGYYILRNDNVYVIIRCGPNGVNGNGGHTHNDQLSLELNIFGNDFIIDPGTYVYTANYKLRNLFRSTFMHNTLQIGNLEQNNYETREVFAINNDADAQLLDFDDNYFIGRHYGFREKAGTMLEREVKLKDKKIIINDFLMENIENSGHKNIIRFHLNNDVEVKKKSSHLILTNKKTKLKLSNLQKYEYSIEKSWFSREYGIKEKTNVINCEVKNSITNTVIEMF